MTTTRFPCNYCEKTFGRKADQTRHENIHKNVKPFLCNHCNKRFPQKSGLKTHLNTHTGARPHKCRHPGCKSAFADPSSCARHLKEKHGPADMYQCDRCPSAIKRVYAFKQHMRDRHNVDPRTVDIPSMIIHSEKGAKKKSARAAYVDNSDAEFYDDFYLPSPVPSTSSDVITMDPDVPQTHVHAIFPGFPADNSMAIQFPMYNNYAPFQQNFTSSPLDMQALYGVDLSRTGTPSSCSSLPSLSFSSSSSPAESPSPGAYNGSDYFNGSINDGHLFNNALRIEGIQSCASFQPTLHLQSTGMSSMQPIQCIQESSLSQLDDLALILLPTNSRPDSRDEHVFDMNMFHNHAPGVYHPYA